MICKTLEKIGDWWTNGDIQICRVGLSRRIEIPRKATTLYMTVRSSKPKRLDNVLIIERVIGDDYACQPIVNGRAVLLDTTAATRLWSTYCGKQLYVAFEWE